ncbi:hypothetical protein F2P56_030823 [Juglans regia]|uniref:ATPase family AAA domain-containing protein 1-A-like n=1 Tax=Juglans regia TaxID=51240 RepID=A0A833TLW0_JUGRE|nr:hypothetical protein F2P56_030823 [Juglans regia]
MVGLVKEHDLPEVYVAAVFSLAHKLQPAIIFIDEVDSFLGRRRNADHEASTKMKTEFMVLWDGFTTDQNARVMVLAATNRPSELDEAILRRLPQAFEIGIPDRRERAEILRVILRDERVEEDLDYDILSSLCEGYTGSDLLELCKKAAYFPIRDLLDEEKKGKRSSAPRPLAQSDLEKVLVLSHKTAEGQAEVDEPGIKLSLLINSSGWDVVKLWSLVNVGMELNQTSRYNVSMEEVALAETIIKENDFLVLASLSSYNSY